MKLFLVIVSMAALSVASTSAQQPKVQPIPRSPEVVTNSLPANPDAAWNEIATASKPPQAPAEWAGKAPTPEQRDKFAKFLGLEAAVVAAKAKEFYTRFPEHAKATEAKQHEKRFLQVAVDLGNTAVIDEAAANLPEDKKFEQKMNAVHRRALEQRAGGPAAITKEFEAGLRELMKEYPDQPALWGQMLMLATNTLDKEQKKRLLSEIIRSSVADPDTITVAKGLIKSIGAIGHPLEIAFTAVDGRKVDIQKMKGKVVLIDFWAAWCGPCIQALPGILGLYNKYKDQGFDIVGINMDKQQYAMDQVVNRFKMPWPQYFDGQGPGTKYALEYSVITIPALWLVDKAGVLRTMEAHKNIEQQIKDLLAEKL